MNSFPWSRIAKYNKATAAAVSQAIVQLTAAFVQFPPDLEQAIGIVLTSLLVYFVPNNAGTTSRQQHKPATAEPLVAHLPMHAMAAAVAMSLFLAGCANLVSGDAIADKVLGPDCGPESRVVRARALTDGIGRAYPDLPLAAMEHAVGAMADALANGDGFEPAASAFQNATLSTLAPMVLAAGKAGEPAWQSLLHLPPVAAELVPIRRLVAAFCATA